MMGTHAKIVFFNSSTLQRLKEKVAILMNKSCSIHEAQTRARGFELQNRLNFAILK